MKRRAVKVLLALSLLSMGGLPLRGSGVSAAPASLPSWVPGTIGEAGFVPMTNTLDSVALNGVWSGSSAAQLTDYSGGCYNPYYGSWGAHVIHGGGHASANDNSVFIANFNTLAFERLGGPTQLASQADYENRIRTGGFPDDISNPREVEPGVPGSAHTYDTLLVLSPSASGDPYGALIRPVSGAVGVEVSRETGWSHAFTFTNRQWSRWSVNYARSWTPGGTCAYDTSRGIIWPISDANMNYRSYLTLSNRTFTNIPEHPGLNSYPDMLYSTYCAHRDAIVIATNRDGESSIRMYWFPAGSTGGERRPVSFSTGPLPHANWGRGSLMYVPELQKMVYWTQSTIDTYYEIDVPADPSSPWSWVARPITGAAKPSTLSPAPAGSTYHRMDYAAPLKSLVWVTAQSANTFHFGGRVVCIRIVGGGGGGPGDTEPPAVPTNLQATAVSSSRIDLSWNASADNVAAAGYRIHRAGTQIATTSGASYSNTGLPASTTYTYAVAAVDAAGNVSAQSSPASATTLAGGGGGVPSAVSLTLINADTDQAIAGFESMNDGALLNLGTLPTRNLSLAANTSPATVGSVVFGYDGNASYQTENGGPYAVAGDNAGDYNAWTPTVGNHSVSATPFTQSGGSGTAGAGIVRSFTVIDDPSTPSSNGPPGGGRGGGGDGGRSGSCGAIGLEGIFLAGIVVWLRTRRNRPGTAEIRGRKMKAGAAALLVVLGASFLQGQAPVQQKDSRRLSPAEFSRLHQMLKPQSGESRWMEIAWYPSVWEGRMKAAAEGKPLLLWAGSGGAPSAGC